METYYFRPNEEQLAGYMPKGVSRGILRNVLAVFNKMERICTNIRSSIDDVLGDSGHLRQAADEIVEVLRTVIEMSGVTEYAEEDWEDFGAYANVAVLLSELHRTLMQTYTFSKKKFEIIGGSGGYKAVLEQIEGLHRYLGMYEIAPGDDNEWYNVIRSFSSEGDDLVRCITNNTSLTAMAAMEFGLDGESGDGLAEYVKDDPQRVRRLMAERFEATLTSLERIEFGGKMWAGNFRNIKRELEECLRVIDDIVGNLKDEMEQLITVHSGDERVTLEMLQDKLFGESGAMGLVYGYFRVIGANPENGEEDIKNRPLETIPESYDTIGNTYESFYRPMMGILHHIKEGNYESVASRVTRRHQEEGSENEDIA